MFGTIDAYRRVTESRPQASPNEQLTACQFGALHPDSQSGAGSSVGRLTRLHRSSQSVMLPHLHVGGRYGIGLGQGRAPEGTIQ
jgi:hypothetical protein